MATDQVDLKVEQEDWQQVKLKDICQENSGLYGINESAVPYKPDLYRYLRITDITDNGEIDESKKVSVNIKKGEASKYLLNKNDLVFARTGASAGRTYFYTGQEEPMIYAGFLIKFSLDESKVIPQYMKYYCLSNTYKNWVQSVSTGSTRPNINATMYGNMTLDLPPVKQQKLVVDTLSALDQKIAINKEIDRNLEAQAQAIFKYYFVDFGLVDKNNGMVKSELGMIPKGWEIAPLGKSKLGKLLPSGIDHFKGKKIYLATADVSQSAIVNHSTQITMDQRPSRANMQPKANTLWFAKMKDSRKLLLVDSTDVILQDKYIFSTGFAGIQCTQKSLYYIWTYLQSEAFDTIKNAFCTGTTMQSINNQNINRIKILVPSDQLLEEFNKTVKDLFKIIINHRNQNIHLLEIRDALLLKLMSRDH